MIDGATSPTWFMLVICNLSTDLRICSYTGTVPNYSTWKVIHPLLHNITMVQFCGINHINTIQKWEKDNRDELLICKKTLEQEQLRGDMLRV